MVALNYCQGGNALKFYASVRLDIRRTGSVKEGDEVVGNETRVKVVKNKVAPPFRQAEFQILYGKGVESLGEIVDLGVKYGIIDKAGAWYSCNGTKIGQGKKNAGLWLEEKPKERENIEKQIREIALDVDKPKEDSKNKKTSKSSEEGKELKEMGGELPLNKDDKIDF